jgi:hypothetical protein
LRYYASDRLGPVINSPVSAGGDHAHTALAW